jgi:hypothetical protein
MTHLREHWEGVSLSGDYTLEQWLGGDDSAAFFRTAPAPNGRCAVVKLVPEAVVDGTATLDLLHRTRQLRHPNLIELLDCGRADHSGEVVLYAVFESPDDTLAAALSRSPLNPQESREVIDSVLDALRYLHAQGLAHGALDPDHIVAVGDRIKLSTDVLRDANTSAAYRKDVRMLGDLWQQALMAASPKSSEIAVHAADPNPQTRWTLAEINAALNPSIPTVPPPAPPLAISSPISVAPVSESTVSEPLTVVRDDAPALPPADRRPAEPATANRFLKWIVAGAAGVLLLIFGLNRPRPANVATQSRVASISLPAETPVPAPLPRATVPKSFPAAGGEMWRVIAFTYRTRDAAATKVHQLNRHHPGLNATVFSPKDKRGYYLVSVGGRMSRDEAMRLQRSARGKGLPRDLYVQNYAE